MFSDTAEVLLERIELQEANVGTYKGAVEATGQEQTDVVEDRANLQFVLNYAALIEANKSTVTKIKNSIYNGEENEPVAAFPAFPTAVPPFALRAGIEARFRTRNARWRTAPGYTPEIGVALGIIQATNELPSPDSLIAALALKDLGSYQYEADFKKQGQDAMFIQQRGKGTEKWFEAKTALSSPAVISVDAPLIEGAAVQVEIRGRLMKGNGQIGQWSPIYPLTVNS